MNKYNKYKEKIANCEHQIISSFSQLLNKHNLYTHKIKHYMQIGGYDTKLIEQMDVTQRELEEISKKIIEIYRKLQEDCKKEVDEKHVIEMVTMLAKKNNINVDEQLTRLTKINTDSFVKRQTQLLNENEAKTKKEKLLENARLNARKR